MPNPHTDGCYAYYSLCACREVLQSHGKGSTFMELTPVELGNLSIPVPPLDEQRAIAVFLDRATERIDRLVSRIESAIERLQEYRTALITAAVTGQIDVREAALTLPAD